MKFHGMIKEVDLLHSRIAELEDENVRLKNGSCRFNCRTKKEAFKAGMIAVMQEFGREFGMTQFTAWDKADQAILDRLYGEWRKDRTGD